MGRSAALLALQDAANRLASSRARSILARRTGCGEPSSIGCSSACGRRRRPAPPAPAAGRGRLRPGHRGCGTSPNRAARARGRGRRQSAAARRAGERAAGRGRGGDLPGTLASSPPGCRSASISSFEAAWTTLIRRPGGCLSSRRCWGPRSIPWSPPTCSAFPPSELLPSLEALLAGRVGGARDRGRGVPPRPRAQINDREHPAPFRRALHVQIGRTLLEHGGRR